MKRRAGLIVTKDNLYKFATMLILSTMDKHGNIIIWIQEV